MPPHSSTYLGFSLICLKAFSLARFFFDLWRRELFPGWRKHQYATTTCLLRLGFHLYNWCYNLGLSLWEWCQFRHQSSLLKVENLRQQHLFYPSAFHLSWQSIVHLPPAQSLRLAYGETSWLTLRHLMAVIQPTPTDVFCDLGCGAGRNLFYMRICHDLKVVGIEWLTALADVIEQVQQTIHLSDVESRIEDFLTASLTGITIVYITANGLDRSALNQLSQHLQTQSDIRWVLSVGKPLTFTYFERYGVYRLWFSWGRDWVYMYQRKDEIPQKKYRLRARNDLYRS